MCEQSTKVSTLFKTIIVLVIEQKGANIITKNKTDLENKLWDNWIKTRDEAAANELINYYMYLVSFHVDRIAINLPHYVDRNDLESFGLLGLFDALNKFEPKRQLKFDTYASFRIRGSIIDGLRKEDWLPRSLREKTKQLESTTHELEQELQRKPTSEEIAVQLGITSEEVESIVSDSLFSNILSIEGNQAEDGNTAYSLPDDQLLSPEQNILDIEIKTDLAKGLKGLNENEKMVISLFYDDELTMTEIGDVLDLTTSRISQIHKRALFKLKDLVEKAQKKS